MKPAETWQLQQAKARFSQLVRSAATRGPQEITVHGRPVAVVVSRRDYDRLRRPQKKSLVEFMRKSPLAGSTLSFKRDASLTRKVRL